ncbi:MAG: hypothetical protein GY820_22455 [Gammaproteobacteria bacterium]|nr:hypothetical protein [Gammaproteobacteria bacterium]
MANTSLEILRKQEVGADVNLDKILSRSRRSANQTAQFDELNFFCVITSKVS